MRIIAGKDKNRTIKSKKGNDTRPTLESVREALFSIIAQRVPESCFLDLYSGSGAIALEALSRGAKRAVMIESDSEAIKIIIENINSIGYGDHSRAYKNDAFRAIKILGRKNELFDIIFMDPPYSLNICESVVNAIGKEKILKPDGIIICEHYHMEKMKMEILNFEKFDERDYSKKIITFYKYKDKI
jgi:16S rRNA (guanine(966)-N(2))-methyltransferase RsmD